MENRYGSVLEFNLDYDSSNVVAGSVTVEPDSMVIEVTAESFDLEGMVLLSDTSQDAFELVDAEFEITDSNGGATLVEAQANVSASVSGDGMSVNVKDFYLLVGESSSAEYSYSYGVEAHDDGDMRRKLVSQGPRPAHWPSANAVFPSRC